MTPEMQEALYQLSIFQAPEPGEVFQKVVETLAAFYDNTTAMINLLGDGELHFRAVVNPLPGMKKRSSLALQSTFCTFAMQDVCPLVLQNAAQHPAFQRHLAVRLNLNRYLGVPVCNPNGEPVGTLCFLDNKVDQVLGEQDVRFLSLLAMRVSAELERERSIQARVSEHRETAERQARLNTRLEATMQEKQRFVSMIVHDLRHPLTALQTLIYLLRDEQNPDERNAYLDLLDNRVLTLANLLDGLRQYNEIEAGRIRLNLEKVALQTLVQQCVENFAPTFAEDSVEFLCEIAPNIGHACTDTDKFNHILLNLLSNALKFTTKGTIWIRVRHGDDSRWILEVEDTGIGMTPEIQQRIFEEFYRAPDASERRGSGLGLAIVRQLCGALNATIAVQSQPGAGTRFTLSFPRTLTTVPN